MGALWGNSEKEEEKQLSWKRGTGNFSRDRKGLDEA